MPLDSTFPHYIHSYISRAAEVDILGNGWVLPDGQSLGICIRDWDTYQSLRPSSHCPQSLQASYYQKRKLPRSH